MSAVLAHRLTALPARLTSFVGAKLVRAASFVSYSAPFAGYLPLLFRVH